MRRGVRRPLVALVALVLALVVGYVIKGLDSGSRGQHNPSASTSVLSGSAVPLSSLPAQAAQTVRLIERGGPFPYPRSDGEVFRNDEHRLPPEPDGYYREYTVPTPGSDDRGARRIIRAADGTLFYTGDHYDTFGRVDEAR
ncbi:MAG: ribonuclease N [Actinomycetota bacterium]|nr:ribonuclease N [Actinomycetota bacterium]